VSYAELAAKRATEVYAYGEAVRLLEQALKVQEVLDPEDKAKKCDLLLALGDVLLLAGEHQRVYSTEAPQALSLAEAISDNKRACRACLLAMTGLVVYGTIMLASPEAAQWSARADRYAEPETVGRARADSMLGAVEMSGGGSMTAAAGRFSRGLELARRLGDTDTYWLTAVFWVWGVVGLKHEEERLRLAEKLAGQSWQGLSLEILSFGLHQIVHTFLEFGQRDRAEEIMTEIEKLAERSGQPNLLIMCMFHEAIMAIWDGHLEEAIAIRRRMLARAEELGIFQFAVVWASWILPARLHLGDAGRALEANLQGAKSLPQNVSGELLISLCLAYLERYGEVAEMLERWVVSRPGDEWASIFADTISLESAVLAGHREAAEILLGRQAKSSGRTTGLWLTTCRSRHLGAAAALLGRYDEARKHYQEAIKVCAEIRFRPELALAHLQLAELLLEHYPDEKKEALEHLDFAIKEFQEMKMQPSLERALRHKDILKA